MIEVEQSTDPGATLNQHRFKRVGRRTARIAHGYMLEGIKSPCPRRVRLEKLGNTPPLVDRQIAAVALMNGPAVVTANPKDFKQFKGLAVLNWGSK